MYLGLDGIAGAPLQVCPQQCTFMSYECCALGTQMVEQRINSEVQIKVLIKPMNTAHWALALVKGIREPHEAKKNIF